MAGWLIPVDALQHFARLRRRFFDINIVQKVQQVARTKKVLSVDCELHSPSATARVTPTTRMFYY